MAVCNISSPSSFEQEKNSGKNNHVESPDHYTAGRQYEPLKVIFDWGLDQKFCLANALKYISRAGRKGERLEDEIQDLQKAIFYLRTHIKRLELGNIA